MLTDGVIRSELIFDHAPFPSCHAATLVETADGILCAWFGGTREGQPDVSIWTARLRGNRWTQPQMVASGNGLPCWNPVLFQPKDGLLQLFYKIGPSPSKWWGMLQTSQDGGRTWSAPDRLPAPLLGPAKNKPVQLSDGTIISPGSVEGDIGWRVYFETSVDGGRTFSAGPFVDQPPDLKALQPTILIHSDTRLQAICRTTGGRLFQTWSEDAGKTWSKLESTDLPNCNSGIDAATIIVRPGGSASAAGSVRSEHVPDSVGSRLHLLVYNHSNLEKVRYPLCVAISRDGRLWQAAIELETEPPGQYSYPAVIQSRDGLVHVVYTWKRRSIKHVVIDPAGLRPKPLAVFRCPPPGSPTHRSDEFQ
ncbi:MAG: exo-alpha-sialidase [Phycisphaerae bacterium]|nr:exo-alpha-sialidase [Phycisphaerae bacterium]MDW8262454.1 sialidase family protein [Phycisphaerales bacterium]